jgi:hypothetical protein
VEEIFTYAVMINPTASAAMFDFRHAVLAATAVVVFFPGGAHAQSSVTFNGTVAIPFHIPPGQTRPVQISPTGSTFAAPPPPRSRAFVYNNVSPLGAFGLFAGVTGFQWAQGPSFPNANQARIDYWAPNPAKTTHGINEYLDLAFRFRPFYLVGSCAICGVDNTVAAVNSTSVGVSEIINGLTNNSIESFNNQIVFGASGVLGTLSFEALSSGTTGNYTSSGLFSLTASDVPTAKVPAPLPVLGAAAAFTFSRKLRRRIQLLTAEAD